MLIVLARSWQSLALRGLAAVLFGLLTLVWPDVTLLVLVTLFGAYALVDGVAALVAAFRGPPEARAHRGTLVLEGLLSVAAGIVAFVWPDITALALLYLIAAWAVVTGILEIVAAVALRRELENEWFLGLMGAASVLFGVLLFARPGAGALTVTWLIGAYAVAFGALLLALAWRLRRETQPGGRAAGARSLRSRAA